MVGATGNTFFLAVASSGCHGSKFLASPCPFLVVVAGVVRGGLVGDQTRGQLVLFCPNFVAPGIVAVSLYLVAQQCIVNVSSAFVIIIRMLY